MRVANFLFPLLLIAPPAIAAPAEMDRAFTAAFGHPAPFTVVGDAAKGQAKIIFTPSGLVDVTPGMVALISKGKAACDSCSGTLAIHYLKHSGSEFSLVKAWPTIGGATGQSVAWVLRPDLEGGPAILASHEEDGQDCRQTYSQIIALTPGKPVSRANLLMAVHYDPGPDPDHSPPYSVKAKLVPLEKGKSFDLQYAGTWSLRVEYERKGELYAPKQREAPACQ